MDWLATLERTSCWLRRERNRCAKRQRFNKNSWRFSVRIEWLEPRQMLSGISAAVAEPPFIVNSPLGLNTVTGLTPAQISHAYGFDQISFGNSILGDGTGQTIAIIDAYHSPTIQNDLHQFDLAFGLPDPPSFTQVAQDGSNNFPPVDPAGPGSSWEVETALDVEWAHALAPAAKILLVEANSNSNSDLMEAAVDYARSQSGVSVISMSFSGGEDGSELSLDPHFTTPNGHQGITFLASTGDKGKPGGYPAYSPNVVAVGGTTLSNDATGNYLGESGWSGSGGGISTVEAIPSYQQGISPDPTFRATPDISLNADPTTGEAVYDSYDFGATPWVQVGGTSFSTPAWAALIAIADQGRTLLGLGTLDGPSQTLPTLYSLRGAGVFHDITSGNNGFAATAGYDLVTGLGSPEANLVVAGLTGTLINGTSGDDTFRIYIKPSDPSIVEVQQNGVVIDDFALAGMDSLTINGLGGDDELIVDGSQGLITFPGGITFNGGDGADKLAITGTPPTGPIGRETYIVGATADAGKWILDPDDSAGPGAAGPLGADAQVVNFTGLSPVDTDTPAINFDVIMNASDNDATISQDGMLLNGFASLLVTDNNATFETFRFANKIHVRIMGQGGSDTLTANFATPSNLLSTLELDGDVADGVMGQPADDNATDTLKVLQDAPGLASVTLAGQGGDDLFTVGNGNLTQIMTSVAVIGGETVGNTSDSDSLTVDDSLRPDAVDYHVDPTTIAICVSPGPPAIDADVATFDATLEHVHLNGTQGINQFDVTPSANTDFTIDGELPSAPPGDYLSVRFAGTTGAHLTNTAGTGSWTFTNRMAVNFANIERFNFFPTVVYAAAAAKNGKPTVVVVNADDPTDVVTTFQAYESGGTPKTTFQQGVRVAMGDINGDGIPEIITAPGHNHSPLVKVFDISGNLLTSFNAYAASFIGGVNVSVGDVNGDGFNDIVVAPSGGAAEIRVFFNQSASMPTTPFSATNYEHFLAFKKNFIGGATVAAGDVVDGAPVNSAAEIIVGSGPGMRDTALVFNASALVASSVAVKTPTTPLLTILPFANNQRGGVNVALGNLAGDSKFEILIGAGVGGGSQLVTYNLNNSIASPPTLINSYAQLFTTPQGNASNAPLQVAALAEANAGGTLETDIFLAQGADGVSQTLRKIPPVGPVVDLLMENNVEFRDGFYIATDINAAAPFIC